MHATQHPSAHDAPVRSLCRRCQRSFIAAACTGKSKGFGGSRQHSRPAADDSGVPDDAEELHVDLGVRATFF